MPISKDKAEKLIQLARRGVGGEATNAQAICERNGIEWRESKTEKAYQPGGRSTGGTGTNKTEWEYFDEILKEASNASGFRRDFGFDRGREEPPFFNKNARINDVNSRADLNIALIIAQKLYPTDKLNNYEWDDFFKYLHFPNLPPEHNANLNRIYKMNKDRFAQVAVRAANEAMRKLSLIH